MECHPRDRSCGQIQLADDWQYLQPPWTLCHGTFERPDTPDSVPNSPSLDHGIFELSRIYHEAKGIYWTLWKILHFLFEIVCFNDSSESALRTIIMVHVMHLKLTMLNLTELSWRSMTLFSNRYLGLPSWGSRSQIWYHNSMVLDPLQRLSFPKFPILIMEIVRPPPTFPTMARTMALNGIL